MTDPRYAVSWEASASRELRKLPEDGRRRVVRLVGGLADDPRPHGCTKLSGCDTFWRVRSGNYRVVYEVDDGKLTVLVVAVGNRRYIYG